MAEEGRNGFQKLVELVEVLRGPEGCPWDREQTRESLKPLLIEEAYEVLEALDGDDSEELRDELGDLLLQVIFHSSIASEQGEFDIEQVCQGSYEKMVRRHPHVFGEADYRDSSELLRNWEDIKAAERESSGRSGKTKESLLDGIPEKLPALYTGYQLSSKAARVGFDWDDLDGITAQLLEELQELKDSVSGQQPGQIKEEVGDLLFTVLNIARRLEVDPETALQQANRKFARRFRAVEKHFTSQGRSLKDVPVGEMEMVWQQQKREAERAETDRSG